MTRRHSLVVRTLGFHPGSRGSTPRGGAFFAVSSNGKTRVFGTRYRGSNPCTAAFGVITIASIHARVVELVYTVDLKSTGYKALQVRVLPRALSKNPANGLAYPNWQRKPTQNRYSVGSTPTASTKRT